MKIKNNGLSILLILLCPYFLFFSGCKKLKNSPGLLSGKEIEEIQMKEEEIKHRIGELDFFVKNKTQRPIFVTCFYYAKKETTAIWKWYKTDVIKLNPTQASLIDIDTLPDRDNREYVYGYLGVFNSQVEADTAIYELLSEKNKVDIEKLTKIKGKTVIIETDRYGFKGEVLNFRIKDENVDKKLATIPSLDFRVYNKTGKDLWLTCFLYEKQSKVQRQWEFRKTPVVKLNNNDSTIINIDPVAEEYDRKNVRGFLAAFSEDEKKIAEEATYELTPLNKLIKLGKLYRLNGLNVILKAKKYGLEIDTNDNPKTYFFEFSLEITPKDEMLPNEEPLFNQDVPYQMSEA